MEQTAVEWLVEQLAKIRQQNSGYRNIKTEFRELIEQAKAMEKEQMQEMYLKGIENYDPTFKRKDNAN